jgi:ADP-ribose pyrophosphatase
MGPHADDHLIEHPVDSITQLDGGFLTVKLDTVRLPDGRQATRQYIQHPGAVAVLPILDDGRIVMVRQYRYAVDAVLIEVPAGKLDANESVLDCGRRELLEETGYSATEWARAGVFHNAAAYSTEGIEIWFARGLVAGPQRLDDGEFVEVCLATEAELDTLASSGGISDMKTMIALQWLQQWRAGRWPLVWQVVAQEVPHAVSQDPASAAFAPVGR